MTEINPTELLKPKRRISGMSAILLPLEQGNSVDWSGFDGHVRRTFDAGLVPAINMDTGYGNLIDEATRAETLRRTKGIAEGRDFIAGAFVSDGPGATFNKEQYARSTEQIQSFGGTPILFQSYGLAHHNDAQVIANYEAIAANCDRFYAFELGTMFAPFGKVYSLEVYRQLMLIDECLGAKHSSLSRDLEWQRLVLRDSVRPEFKVLTGNDLAIDMVMYGSDYLLGLSTFAPEAFALRDRMWEQGDNAFYELNDLLQYLGTFAFRRPVPAYKHNAAMFLKLGSHIKTDLTYPGSPERPTSDLEILSQIHEDLQTKLAAAQ
ncbi:dihydrodipicolinate synthase family protein [Rhodopirellula baltica]|nr:dihydrodipicolinate synthase family protein [Rhodopirellula baltica]